MNNKRLEEDINLSNHEEDLDTHGYNDLETFENNDFSDLMEGSYLGDKYYGFYGKVRFLVDLVNNRLTRLCGYLFNKERKSYLTMKQREKAKGWRTLESERKARYNKMTIKERIQASREARKVVENDIKLCDREED